MLNVSGTGQARWGSPVKQGAAAVALWRLWVPLACRFSRGPPIPSAPLPTCALALAVEGPYRHHIKRVAHTLQVVLLQLQAVRHSGCGSW